MKISLLEPIYQSLKFPAPALAGNSSTAQFDCLDSCSFVFIRGPFSSTLVGAERRRQGDSYEN